jgi:lysophospholipase L1-like esterase
VRRTNSVLLLALVVILCLSACATASHAPTPSSAVTMFSSTRFVAVGDSITVGNSPAFSDGFTGTLSWVTYARSRKLLFAGGWAAGGATTLRMAQSIRPVKADVLVILAGTNDLAQGMPFSETAANLNLIVAEIGAPRVVVSAIPPRDSAPTATAAFNVTLQAFVLSRGWDWIDAPSSLRSGAVYAPGMSLDGVHPTGAGAEALGKAFQAALIR